MDDRGKFIYISPEEMKAVADYIKRTGRVSIATLASKSNEFIDLEPKPVEITDELVDEVGNEVASVIREREERSEARDAGGCQVATPIFEHEQSSPVSQLSLPD
eukprot:TRINITY_DN9862_c0_g1_i2.p1 TRINITY_DN9862_c0_g1~~TRINITY_DN9862_c0_g1_i2.p1  ORF type:complete len:104 (+),score=10.57 TRINITY_DN9862_c0_g1_i2:150-461(+)